MGKTAENEASFLFVFENLPYSWLFGSLGSLQAGGGSPWLSGGVLPFLSLLRE